MKESGYGAQLARKIEVQLGGKVVKLADRSSLGRPDNLWLKNGIATFIETKIGSHHDDDCCYPWKEINDLRQFEVCRNFSRHSLVIYAIYYPNMKKSAILEVNFLATYRVGIGGGPKPYHTWTDGHGIETINELAQEDRRYRYDQLVIEREKFSRGISK